MPSLNTCSCIAVAVAGSMLLARPAGAEGRPPAWGTKLAPWGVQFDLGYSTLVLDETVAEQYAFGQRGHGLHFGIGVVYSEIAVLRLAAGWDSHAEKAPESVETTGGERDRGVGTSYGTVSLGARLPFLRFGGDGAFGVTIGGNGGFTWIDTTRGYGDSCVDCPSSEVPVDGGPFVGPELMVASVTDSGVVGLAGGYQVYFGGSDLRSMLTILLSCVF